MDVIRFKMAKPISNRYEPEKILAAVQRCCKRFRCSSSDGKNKLPSTPLTNLKVVHHYSSAPVEEWDEENEEGGKATGGDGTLIIHHPAPSPPLSFQTGGRERCLPPIVLACDSFSLTTHLM